MKFISVCKNVIAANNKKGWSDPDPAIRVSNSKSGKVVARGHEIAIKDRDGNVVARIISTQDGNPIISCGAKVAILAEHDIEVIS